MPCSSNYLEPSIRERELQRAAHLLFYVRCGLSQPVEYELVAASKDCFCQADYIPQLCSTLKGLSSEQMERIVYDAHSPHARDLADWWETHQAADAAREKKEKEDAERTRIQQAALSKLTAEERRAFGF